MYSRQLGTRGAGRKMGKGCGSFWTSRLLAPDAGINREIGRYKGTCKNLGRILLEVECEIDCICMLRLFGSFDLLGKTTKMNGDGKPKYKLWKRMVCARKEREREREQLGFPVSSPLPPPERLQPVPRCCR